MRLTEKYDINYKHKDISKAELDNMYSCLKDRNLLAQLFWKLGKLEDIEDELGIDLIALFKALKNGIYKKDYLDCCYDTKLRFMKDEWYLAQPFDENYAHIVKTKDYGKTWALTREELD